MKDQWQGKPNKLLATTLNSSETVPNDSNLGIITPGLNAKAEKYNQLMAAYNTDFVQSDDNDLFNFSSHRTSEWAINASAAEQTRTLKAMSVVTEEAVQDLQPDQISMIPPSDKMALERLLTGGIGHPWHIPSDGKTSFVHEPPSPKVGVNSVATPEVSLRGALLKAGGSFVAGRSNASAVHAAIGTRALNNDTSLADRVGDVAVVGLADGDANSTLLAAYWDHQSCGPGIDDQNAHWCGGGSSVPPACKPMVAVQPKVCASGAANLQYVLGGGTFDEGVVLAKCRYAFFAQYACGSV
jgi:hypothetical protein